MLVCVYVGGVEPLICLTKGTYIGKLEFFTVIHVGYCDFALGYVIVIVNVVRQHAHV